MTPTIYAAEPTAAEDALAAVTDWIRANSITFWTAAVGASLLLLILAIYLTAGALKGRDRKAKATIGYAIVQVGMAYVTITGGYDFWRLVAHMPASEAIALAVFIEAAQWYAIGKTFEWMAQHTDDRPHVGYGRPGAYFWLFVGGGSLLAVLGAFLGQHNGPLSIGRTVAVVIGSLLWDLLLREKMHRDETIPPTVLLLTWRKLGIRLGIMAAEQKDVRTQNREYTLRRMSRALRWKNEGKPMWRWWGERYLMRAMDAGDADLLSEAVQRYAMNWLIRDETAADHATMGPALKAARRILSPDVARPELLPPPPQRIPTVRPRLDPPTPAGPPPQQVVVQRQPTQATMARAAQLRRQAVEWATDQLRGGRNLTGAAVASHFDMKDEWGRLRLREAQTEMATNGHAA